LSRTARSYEWKNALLLHSYTMKHQNAKHLSIRVKSLEDLLDLVQKTYANTMELMEKVNKDRCRGCQVEGLTPRARVLKPFQRSPTFNHASGAPNRSDHASRDRSSFWDKSRSFVESEEVLSARLRNYEVTLQSQQAYTVLMREELEEAKREREEGRALVLQVRREIEDERKGERKRWEDYIEEYKTATDIDLISKDQAITKLNEVLSIWVDRYMQLQEQSSSAQLEDLRQLCNWTVQSIRSLHVRPSARTLPPKATSVAAGQGDAPPELDLD